MVKPAFVTAKLDAWALMRFYPANNAEAISVIARMICKMANNEDEVVWLIQRSLDTFDEWPGLVEIRRLFCSRFRPADDIDPNLPDGPMKPLGEADRRKVLAQDADSNVKMLGSGEPISKDPAIVKAVEIAAKLQDLKDTTGLGGPATPEEIQSAPEWLRRMEGYEV